MKSSYKIFAQSPPSFRKHLVKELKSLGAEVISSDLNCKKIKNMQFYLKK